MEVLSGGFKLSAQELALVNTHKALTKQINEKFIQVGAVFLKPASKHPIDEKWSAIVPKQTDLQQWIDDDRQRVLNVGFNLQFGWMDCDIDSADPEYNRCIIAAMDAMGVDTRFRFGRYSAGRPTHVMVQLTEEDAANYERLKVFEPRMIKIGAKTHHTQLRSYSAGEARQAKQTVMPGSLYARKDDHTLPDLSVWYAGNKIASNVHDITRTTPRVASFTSVVRAVSFGTILYLMKDHWIEGQRQLIAAKFTGWLARVVKDSQALNEHESVSKEVFCPIDNDSWAEKLIRFICEEQGDDEAHMRVRVYYDAVEKLARNPDAKVPGWNALNQAIGTDAVQAIRNAIMPGADVSNLTKMAERYVYDETDNHYIDRLRHPSHAQFTHEGTELERRHRGDVVFINGKPQQTFRIYESSNIRKRVDFRDMYPDIRPGAVVRISSLGHVVSDDSDEDASTVFNTWQGWPILPIDAVEPRIMDECVAYVDRLFGYLTSDHPEQILWLKRWIAWIRQNPGIKQQIAPVIIGGQGIGKSFWGNTFMRAIFGARLWGTASSKIVDNEFNVGPFKNKMFMFIDEAKFTGDTSTEEIKKLIRNVDIGGMEKFQEGREYRIFARLAFASNLFNINISQRNVQDRALFYIRATSKEHREMDEVDFIKWAESLKPWFSQFTERLDDPIFVRHIVRYFVDLPVTKDQIESLEHSSGNEPDVIESNMSWTRRVVKYIIESGYVADVGMSFEMPFTRDNIVNRIEEATRALNFRNISHDQVINDMRMTGMKSFMSKGVRMLRFDKKWGDVIHAFERSTGSVLEPYRDPLPADYGNNECDGSTVIKRITNKASVMGKF